MNLGCCSENLDHLIYCSLACAWQDFTACYDLHAIDDNEGLFIAVISFQYFYGVRKDLCRSQGLEYLKVIAIV